MRFHFHDGRSFGVSVSAREVEEFNSRWPCSSRSGPHYFAYDHTDSLVEHEGIGDGSEAVALSDDAQRWGQARLAKLAKRNARQQRAKFMAARNDHRLPEL